MGRTAEATDRGDAGVVGQHETGDAVRRGDVGRLPRERHLDGRTANEKVKQSSPQTLVTCPSFS